MNTSPSFCIPKKPGQHSQEGNITKPQSQPRSSAYADTAKRLKHRCAPTDLPRWKQRDPRRKITTTTPSAADKKRSEDINYLTWLIKEAIPTNNKSTVYYEKLADNIRADIFTSEQQLEAAKIMSTLGEEVDIGVALKLRKQMDDKLVETLGKLERLKKNLAGLHKLRAEYEAKTNDPTSYIQNRDYTGSVRDIATP